MLPARHLVSVRLAQVIEQLLYRARSRAGEGAAGAGDLASAGIEQRCAGGARFPVAQLDIVTLVDVVAAEAGLYLVRVKGGEVWWEVRRGMQSAVRGRKVEIRSPRASGFSVM